MQRLRDAAAPVTASAASAPIDDSGGSGFLEKLLARAIENAQVMVTNALIRYEDYSHADKPFALEVAFDSLWIHPEHIKAPEPGSSGRGGSSSGGDTRPPMAHREALVCALCAYILDASSLPPQPQLTPCGSAAVLESRMSSSGVALGAPAALRANAKRCCVWPLSFAAELASRRIDEPSLPVHICCVETGRLHIELNASELSCLVAALTHFAKSEELNVHRSFRPPLTQRPSGGHGAAWWRFAGAAVRWQVQLARQPYTWQAVMRRGKQRRAFVKLHQLVLQQDGLEKLSEADRVSLAQLRDSLSAADQILFERLAAAQLQGEMAAGAGGAGSGQDVRRPSLKHRRSSMGAKMGAEMLAAEKAMKLSSQQRKALASMLSKDHDRPMLSERLSVHARLLLADAIITLHTASPEAAPQTSKAAHTPTIRVSVSNVGLHTGLEPGGTAADLYWQSIRVDAIGPRGTTPVPLVGQVPSGSQSGWRRTSRAQFISMEVDTTAAFKAVGLVDKLPALCARSDSAHRASMWQVGLRWNHEQRSAPAGKQKVFITEEY